MAATDCTILVGDRWEPFADDWRELERDGACHPFQTLAWVATAIDTIGRAQGALPKLVLVRDGKNRPLMIVPLAVRRCKGLRILRFVDFQVSDYNAPLIRRDFARSLQLGGFPALWSRILAAVGPVDALRLEKMPATIDDVPNPFLQLDHSVGEQAHFAMIGGDASRYLAGRSKVTVGGFRRKQRNLAKLGTIAFRTAGSTEDAERLAGIMIDWKSQRYRATGATDLFDDPSYADFYRTMAQREWSGLVHLSALTVDGETIAVLFGTLFRGRLCVLMPAFDAGERARYSPGQLHILALIDWCGAEGGTVLDFTWGNEAYKAAWTTDTVPLFDHLEGRTLAGRLWSHGFSLRQIAYRRAKQRMIRHPEVLARLKDWRKRWRDAARRASDTGMEASRRRSSQPRALRKEASS